MEENLKKRILQAQQGNKDVLNELVLENKGLIINVARKFENRGYEFDDLYQIGAIGFIKAVQKFDFSYNVMLSTFAVTYIIGPIKISRQIKEISKKIALEQRNNPNITIEELAKMFNVDKEEIALALDSENCIRSLEDKSDDDEIPLIDKLSSKENNEEIIVNKLALKQCINNLKPREKKIILLRYYKCQTQKKVADIIGISQVQVSRIEKKVLENLSKELKEA